MAQFQILYPYSATEWRPITIEFCLAPNGDQQYLWSSFEDAQAARKRLLERSPHTCLRIALGGAEICEIDWQTREKLRFVDGTYSPTPWHDEPWYQAKHEQHFCHVSTEQVGKIAFTENAAKAQVDRQLVMSPGRYLNRFFSEYLDNSAVEGWCARLSVQLEENALKITQDADEIEEVYVGGPSSCMANAAREFDSYCHPTRVYAGPDTALAYIGSREDARARSIVWPSRKIYTSIYGDVSRLRLLLENAGYVQGRLNGARIRRIEDDDSFVVPYIDAGDNLADDGEYLIIGQGSISSENTSGLGRYSWNCPRCEDETRPHAEVYYAGGYCEEWCYYCYEHLTIYCDHNERFYGDAETFAIIHHDYGTDTVLEDDAADYGAVYVEDRGEWWKSSCCRRCDATGDWFHADDLTEYQGEWLSDAHLPEPFDDDDASLVNAHVLAHRQFRVEMAAIHSDVAKWQATEEYARETRLKREHSEAESLHLQRVRHDADQLHDGAGALVDCPEPPIIRENLVPVIAMTVPAVTATASSAGA